MKDKNTTKKKATRKTLPKDLDELLDAAAASDDYRAVYEALQRCLPDARGGYGKGTLLMNGRCTVELARWAIERGTDIHATDTWGYTALHESARSRFHHRLTPAQLIDLGADVHRTSNEGLTPLHSAVDGKHLDAVQALLAHGAHVNARSTNDLTPLEYGFLRMSNVHLVAMVPVAKALLNAGAEVTQQAKEAVLRASQNFEFHRAGFNSDSVEETSAAAEALCALFSVEPAARRRMHDGNSPIVAIARTPAERFAELWDLLVPSSGPCKTLQGEVVRIAGRVRDEWYRNGGGNWDRDYASMASAFNKHVGTHQALDPADLDACAQVVRSLRKNPDGSDRLVNWAVEWVARNPAPIPLPPPPYQR
ncbi:MAG: ankyrin repeat domain-containing protein [Leptolyngbyaceae cyanobacterium]